MIALAGAATWELVLYETVMFAVVRFQHANVGVPAGLGPRRQAGLRGEGRRLGRGVGEGAPEAACEAIQRGVVRSENTVFLVVRP